MYPINSYLFNFNAQKTYKVNLHSFGKNDNLLISFCFKLKIYLESVGSLTINKEKKEKKKAIRPQISHDYFGSRF